MGNITSGERDILYKYIIEGISTTRLKSEEHYDMSDIEAAFIKYNINYQDRNNGGQGSKGFKRGQHLGKYKKGYVNNNGKLCKVTAEDINDYMNCYLSGRCKTLEEYLSRKYDERIQPKPAAPKSAPKPRPAPQPKPAPQPAYRPSEAGSNSSSYGAAPSYGSSNGIYLVVVVGIIAVLLYKFVISPVLGGIGDIFEKDSVSTSQSQTYIAPDQVCNMKLEVSFYGEQADMLFKYDYIFHFDDQEVGVNVGELNFLSCTTSKGEHKIWVQTGKTKSKVYTIELTDDEALIEFDLKVGIFSPGLKLTNIEGGKKA